MNQTAIYIKTEQATKEKAQKTARELGLSLSSVLNGFLKQFIKTKSITFSADGESPNKQTIAAMKLAEKNLVKGKHSPIFESGEEAVAWLEKQGI